MIPNKSDRVVTGNLQGEKVRMGFAEGAERHLLSLLTDMYSDPELACLREYSTNARDSHVEAGNDAPIEVTLPSPLSPYLKIKDFGVGLSVDDIHALYSKYGASSKRDSNDSTGMLGIGSKSALTYAAQFTIVAVKDGVRCTVAVSRDDDDMNTMTIVDTSSTLDPNGVEVSIPVRAHNNIEQRAKEFFRYWPAGSVLVNGKQPEPLGGLKINDAITLHNNGGYGDDSVVVMGNVAYPAGEHLSPTTLSLPYSHRIVAYVPTGTVDFAPNREQLQFTRRTLAALAEIKDEFQRGLKAAITREIENAKSAPEALRALNQWAQLLMRGSNPARALVDYRWRGRDIPSTLSRPADSKMLLTSATAGYRMSATSNASAVDINYLCNAVFVTDFQPEKMTITHKKKMLQWLEKQSFTASHFVLVDFPLDRTWIDPSRIVDWLTIKAEQLPKTTVAGYSSRLPGSYDLWIKTKSADAPVRQHEIAGDKIDQTKPVYYVHGNARESYNIAGSLAAQVPEFTLVCLPKNRIAKFTRDNPKIAEAYGELSKLYKQWLAQRTDAEKLAMTVSYHDRQTFRALQGHKDKILDPAVVAAIDAVSLDVAKLEHQRRMFTNNGYNSRQDIQWTNPLSRYPLFNGSHLAASVDYINWAYEK